MRSIFSIAPLVVCLLLGCARTGGGSGGGADAGGDRPADAQNPTPTPTDAILTNNDAGGHPSDGFAPTACPAGTTTSITGTTYAPNGKLPLYNVMVYVPSAPLPAFTQGVTCDRCGGSTVRAVASAISNERGEFRITNVPAGRDIPLVVQVGKWRRKVTLPNVVACQANPLTDPNLSRLPRNRQEGDMPKIAVTTGGCDTLGCLLPKIGVDNAELGVAGDDKPVTFYKGNATNLPPGFPAGMMPPPVFGPPNMTPAETLWRNENELAKHDLALLSCECKEFVENKGPAAYEAVAKYLARGGRIFGSDFMYVWYRYSADPALAGALTIVGGAPDGNSPMVIDTTFPKGKALADWMKFLDRNLAYGQIDSDVVFANFTGVMPSAAQVWARSTKPGSGTLEPRIVTINAPVSAPADQQCGRAIHLDAHISPAPGRAMAPPPGQTDFKFPEDCGTTLNKGEEALAFLFFDLAACVQKDTMPVVPPIIVP